MAAEPGNHTAAYNDPLDARDQQDCGAELPQIRSEYFVEGVVGRLPVEWAAEAGGNGRAADQAFQAVAVKRAQAEEIVVRVTPKLKVAEFGMEQAVTEKAVQQETAAEARCRR
jgi:hypothetical protein